jgi:hypothetical protein
MGRLVESKNVNLRPPLNKSFLPCKRPSAERTFDQLQASLLGTHLITIFVTFNAQMARNSETICNFAASNSKRKKIWQQQPQNNAQFIQ